MAANELDAFLKGPESAQPESPAAVPEPEPAAAAAIPGTGTPEPVVQAKVPESDAEAPEGDVEVPDGEPIPRGAFDAIRRERHDWKAKAIQEETRRSELERQLAEAKAAAAAPPPQYQPQQQRQPVPMPNPAIDPEGFAAWLDERQMHQRAHISEMQLREKLGDEKVNSLLVEWQQATARDPSLVQQVAMQNNPYAWAHKKLETLRLQNEIGDDPAAYEARLYAKWEAERAVAPPNGGAPRVSPAAGMQPSLAGARSVASRTAPAFTGPMSLDDILAPVNGTGRTARH